MTSDLPPAYTSLHNSTANIAIPNESDPTCEDGSELLVNNCFEDKTTRIGFIQKVLSIKLLQILLMTLVLGIFAVYQRSIYRSMRHDGSQVHVILLSTLAFLAITGLSIYCTKARRENPYRYVFLTAHPISLVLFISFPAIILDFLSPIALAFLTYVFAVFFVLLYSVFALQTKLEFAVKHAIFLAGIVQILIYAFTVPFIWIDAFGVLYISLALFFDLIYIFWDLEIMTSKKYWHDVTPDNFVDATLNLQLDYYYIFVNIILPKIRKSVETNVQ